MNYARRFIFKFCSGLALYAAFQSIIFPLHSLAQSEKADAGSTETNDSKPPRTLQGGTQKFELSLEKLRDLGLDLKNVLKSASSLYDEVSIRPVMLVTQPQMVGPGAIIQLPIGTQPAGPLQPARKERVDLAMSGLRPVIGLLKKNVDDFVASDRQLNLPDKITNQIQPYLDQWITVVGTMSSQESKLEQLTQGPPYDNAAIGDVAAALHKESTQLDKIRRSVYKILQKEGKRERKLAGNDT